MNIEVKWTIVTNGKQKLLEQNKSRYILEEEDYIFYPLDVHVNVYKSAESNPIGTAVIKELVMKENKTIITYDLVSLHSVN